MTQRAEFLILCGLIAIGIALVAWMEIKTPAEIHPTKHTVINKYCKPLPVNAREIPDKIDV